jgi:hypothetical protein
MQNKEPRVIKPTIRAVGRAKEARAISIRLLGCLLGSLAFARTAGAWGADGHHTVGAIADQMIQGTHAASEVQTLLGTLSLQEASVWADCAKGVDPNSFTYKGAGTYPACANFETPTGEAEMIDFVKRNSTNCTIKPGEEICHKQYHYSDISVAHDHYDSSFVGARDDDIVGAVKAAVEVLKGNPAPAPFDFKDKREALLVLSHYVGDIHQPLHVGAVYLTAKGKRVDPDAGTFDPKTATRGGNQILVNGTTKKFHATWDAIPSSLTVAHVSTLLTVANAVPATTGPVDDWQKVWASETVAQAQAAFTGLTFGAKQNKDWSVNLPNGYSTKSRAIKKTQLTRAGARLAELLKAIWP